MKILVVLGYVVPSQCVSWAECAKAGADLHIAGTTSRFENLPPTLETGPVDGVATHIMRPYRIGGQVSSLFWVYPGIHRVIQEVKPDLVHIVSEPHGMMLHQSLRLHGTVTAHASAIVQEHGPSLELIARRKLAQRAIGRVQGFAGANRMAIASARVRGLDPRKPTVVAQHLVPDPAPFLRAAHSNDGIPASRSELRVGFLGRLSLEKGLDWLIEAMAIAASGGTQLTLLLAGSGPELDRIQDLAEKLSVPLSVLGPVRFEDVPQFFQSIDVLVLPSRTTRQVAEAFGRVVVEAMFSHTPVIASTAGALPEVVGDAAILVEEEDRDGLADALTRMAESSELRALLATRGQEWAITQHSPVSVAGRMIAFWENVLAVSSG